MPVPCGSPPWIMKFGITRWKIVPSYSRSELFFPVLGCFHSRLPSARSMKFCTVFGASFSNRRQTIVPSEVLNVAYVPGWRAMYKSFQKYIQSLNHRVIESLNKVRMIQSLSDSVTQFFSTSGYWSSELRALAQVCARFCVSAHAPRLREGL